MIAIASAGCASTAAVAPVATPRGPIEELGRARPVFVPGEMFTWKVTFKGFEGGRARLAVGGEGMFEGSKVVIVQAEAESSGLFAAIKQVHDNVASWIDLETGLPRRTESSSDLDGKRQVVHTVRTPDSPRADQIIWRYGKTTRESKRHAILPSPSVHDPLSSMFLLRAWDARDGARARFWTLGGTRLWKTELTVEGRETLDTPLGTRACVRIAGVSRRMLSAERVDEKKKPRTFTVWMSDDRQRIPLKIAAHTEYGDILVTAMSYQAP
jgi:hypothetical protein